VSSTLSRWSRRAGDDPLRLAIVGCGAAAMRCHVAGLPHVPEVELVAAVDPVPAHARRLVDGYAALGGDPDRVRVAERPADLEGAVDAAVVATPHRYHAPVAVELLGLGIHCLIEKPMALSVDECDEIAAAARTHGALVAAAHVRRLFPASRWLERLLADGALGRVRSLRWREGAPYDWPLVSPSLFVPDLAGGGVLADAGPHVLDLVLWWLDTPAAHVRSYRDSSRGGAESDAVLELEANGVDVAVELSRLRLLPNACVVVGTEATVELGIDVDAPYTIARADGEVVEEGVVEAIPPAQAEWELLFAEQLRNFAGAIRGQEEVYAGVGAGRRAVATIEACYAARRPLPAPWNDLRPL
jgi:predicted dehydrogenase